MSIEKITMPTIGVAGVGLPSAIYSIELINKFCKDKFSPWTRPNIVMHTPNLLPTYQAEASGRWDIVAEYLLSSIRLLAKMGADFAIIPANSVHRVITEIQQAAPIKVLDILTEVSDIAQSKGYKKVGIMGTVWTLAGHYYQSRLAERGIIEVIPEPDEQLILQDAIMNELVPNARVTPETLQKILTIVQSLKNKGCDAIALACTELPLILDDENCGLPTLDSTAILAEAALRSCIS